MKAGKGIMRFLRFLTENRYAGYALFAVLLAALGFFLHRSVDRIGELDFNSLSPSSIFTALFMVMLAYVNRFVFWTVLTRAFGLRSGTIKAARAFFLSLIGRYIPGKAGLFLFRLRAYSGGTRGRVGASLLTEYLATSLAACFLVVFGTIFIPAESILLTRVLPAAMAILLSLFLRPGFLKRLLNGLLAFLGKQPLSEFPPGPVLVKITLGYILAGLLHGAGFFLLLRASGQAGWEMYPVVTGAYYMAGLIGMFAFFAPGGLGVREGIIFLILPHFADMGPVLLSVAMMRLLTITAELLLTGIAYIPGAFNERGNPVHEE